MLRNPATYIIKIDIWDEHIEKDIKELLYKKGKSILNKLDKMGIGASLYPIEPKNHTHKPIA